MEIKREDSMKTLQYLTPEGERTLRSKLTNAGWSFFEKKDDAEIWERNGKQIKIKKLNWKSNERIA